MAVDDVLDWMKSQNMFFNAQKSKSTRLNKVKIKRSGYILNKAT